MPVLVAFSKMRKAPPSGTFLILFFDTAQRHAGDDMFGENKVYNENRQNRDNQPDIDNTVVGTESFTSHKLYEHRQCVLFL